MKNWYCESKPNRHLEIEEGMMKPKFLKICIKFRNTGPSPSNQNPFFQISNFLIILFHTFLLNFNLSYQTFWTTLVGQTINTVQGVSWIRYHKNFYVHYKSKVILDNVEIISILIVRSTVRLAFNFSRLRFG